MVDRNDWRSDVDLFSARLPAQPASLGSASFVSHLPRLFVCLEKDNTAQEHRRIASWLNKKIAIVNFNRDLNVIWEDDDGHAVQT